MRDVSQIPFDQVRASLDPEWIEQALKATGAASVRRRRLPAEQVVNLVLGIALMRNRRIDEVASILSLALPDAEGSTSVAKSSIIEARARLGEEPLKWLFQTSAKEWVARTGADQQWHGLHLFAVDGTTLRVPDSEENRRHFGSSMSCRGRSGYPLVRMVTLMAIRPRLLLGANFGPYSKGEKTLAADLWSQVPERSLLCVDRDYLSADLLLTAQGHGNEWLTRGRSGLKWSVVERFDRDDAIVEMAVSRSARRRNPSLPATWRMRLIRYHRKGFRSQYLLTSLMDRTKYPKDEVIALYHERWEIELGYDELKTEMLEREETIRSKSPAMVGQELWGLLTVYNLVRLEIERAARLAKVPPRRISFVLALHLIQDEWRWAGDSTSPGTLPKKLQRLREEVARLVIPERDEERLYPRAVKIKMSNYPRKRTRVAR